MATVAAVNAFFSAARELAQRHSAVFPLRLHGFSSWVFCADRKLTGPLAGLLAAWLLLTPVIMLVGSLLQWHLYLGRKCLSEGNRKASSQWMAITASRSRWRSNDRGQPARGYAYYGRSGNKGVQLFVLQRKRKETEWSFTYIVAGMSCRLRGTQYRPRRRRLVEVKHCDLWSNLFCET